MYDSIYKPIVYQRPNGRKEVAYLSRFGILKSTQYETCSE